MARINLNTLAKEVAEKEGLRESLSIAQIKEVIKLTISELAEYYLPSEVLELLERRPKK